VGTRRNIGKTVTCVGIISKLLSHEHGYSIDEIGYIKPVGQQTVQVQNCQGVPIEADKDAVLLTSLLGIDCGDYQDLSPVVWQGGLTASFIDDACNGGAHSGREAFLRRIREAYERVSQGKRVVIVEGTGQPGVGSVAGISNADVINELRRMGVQLYVVLVAPGGIGSTIDEVFPYLMTLDHVGTRLDGLIINDVIPSKMDKVAHYLRGYYRRVFGDLYGTYFKAQTPPTILGFVPTVEELRLPSVRLVAEQLSHSPHTEMEIVAPEDVNEACGLIRKVKVISLEFGYEPFVAPGDAVVVGVNANDVILSMLLLHERMCRQHGEGLSGLILSCKTVGGLSKQIRDLIVSGDVPTIMLASDSADIVKQIEGMTVKIQPYDTIKKELIARTYDEHLTLWPELLG
jgi:dethiobiotin synthetase